MIDHHEFRDHRRIAAMDTSNAALERGYDFRPIDYAPAWVRGLDSLISAFAKPYVWFALAMLVGSLSLFWI